MDDPIAAALDRLWQANRATILARIETVLAALEAGPIERTVAQEAAGQAHALAGALGTYGRPGSELFAEVERVLAEPGKEADFAELAAQVRETLRLVS